MASWRHAQDYSLALMSAHCSMAPSSCVFITLLMSAHWPIGNQEHSWLLLPAYECSWVLMGPYECSWLLIGTLKQPWTLMCLVLWSNERSLELKSIYEHSAMGPWGLISTHEHSWCHCTILMRAFESSWALMRGHERPWELMSAKLLY